MTTNQIRDRTKTVTRRFGWWFLKAGDKVMAVEKCMGLKKGEKIKKICPIEIVCTSREALWMITQEDCMLEGFPDYTPAQFITMMSQETGHLAHESVNRIEFKYVEEENEPTENSHAFRN